jgi:WD40 repeat protein
MSQNPDRSARLGSLPDLPAPAWDRLERILGRFEEAWQRGDRPTLKDYLAGFESERRALLIELIHEDLEHRLRAGEPARVEAYLHRYPEIAADRAVVLGLITAEYVLRCRHEPGCSPAEYGQRFPEYAETLATRLVNPPVAGPVFRPPTSDSADSAGLPSRPVAQETNSPPAGTPSPPAASLRFVPRTDSAPEGPMSRLTIPGYQILGELGRGGMGVVYRARQTSLDRLVALKMVLTGVHAGPGERARFRREAEAVARLQHPHIVQIHEIGEHDGTPFFSLEYVPAGSLDKKLNGTPLPAHEAAQLLETLARTIHAAHEQGIIHRDLKPANVLLTKDGQPKITDFGLAKRLDPGPGALAPGGRTETGAIIGTPSYMAPEQAGGPSKAIGPPADIYALGAILYECLTGRPPFRAETPLDIVRQVLSQEPVSPSRLNPRVPRDLETIALKCLNKAPSNRYTTTVEMADDLRRFQTGEPILARPVGLWERSWRWARRRPAQAALVGVSSLALLALVGVGVGRVYSSRLEVAYESERDARDRAEKAQREVERQRAREEELLRLQENIHRLAVAQSEWHAGRVGRAEQILASCPASLRGWEWHYLRQLCRGELLSLSGHRGEVTCVAYRPDGRRLVSADKAGTVIVRDANTGQNLLTFAGHKDTIWSVTFSPSGRRLATAGNDGTVGIWAANSGRKIHALVHEGPMTSIAWSPDGQHLVSACQDGTVRVWNALTGEPLGRLEGKAVNIQEVAFSPDGRSVAGSSFRFQVQGGRPVYLGQVKAWNLSTRKEMFSAEGHTDRVLSLAFSPDGQYLASGSEDRTIRIWTAATGQKVHTLRGHTELVRRIAFHPDGRRLASAAWDGTVRVWEVPDGQEVMTLRGHSGPVNGIAFSPDGTRLASAGADQTVRVWDATTSPEATTLHGDLPVLSAHAIAFSPNGRQFASLGEPRTVKVWDIAAGLDVFLWRGQQELARGIAFSPDGKRLATAFADNTVKVWDADNGRGALVLRGNTKGIKILTFSPDGKLLAGAGPDSLVRLWDAATGEELQPFKGHKDVVRCVSFSPDGKRLASGDGTAVGPGKPGEVIVWDLATGREERRFAGHTGAVLCVAFHKDSRRLASGGADQAVKIWDARSGKLRHFLHGHTDAVQALVFSRDGSRLATAGADKTVRIWDPDHGLETLTLPGHLAPVHTVAFGPKDRWLASADHSYAVRLWRAEPLTAAQRQAALEKREYGCHLREGEVAVAANRGFAADWRLDRLASWKTAEPWLLYRRGVLRAQRQRWRRAAMDFKRATAEEDATLMMWSHHALLCWHLGDGEGHRAACKALLERFGDSAQPDVINNVAWFCIRAPYPLADLTRPLGMVERLADKNPGLKDAQGTLGDAFYRTANFQKAIAKLTPLIPARLGSDDALNLLFLAMATRKVGRARQAEEMLTRASRWIDRTVLGEPGNEQELKLAWDQWLELRLVRREAERIVRGGG